MANDYLFIVCDYCGEREGLAKWWPSRGFVSSATTGPFVWMDKHYHCRPERLHIGFTGQDLLGVSGFHLETASGSAV